MLLRRVDKFGASRATPPEQRWAARLYDELSAAYVAALSSPGARAALEAVDRRTAVRRKTPARTPDRNLLTGDSDAAHRASRP